MLHRSASERLVAWLVTGPVGHLVAGVVDWATMLARWQWAQRASSVRRRLAR